MNKGVIFSLCIFTTISSCGTYTGTGAYAGSMIGSILGSAIGGINDGPRGSDVGTIIGMAAGAAVGAAVGSAADNSQRQNEESQDVQYNKRESANQQQYQQQNQQYQQQNQEDSDSGFDPSNSNDDRIYEYNDDTYKGSYSAVKPQTVNPIVDNNNSNDGTTNDYGFSLNPTIAIKNARFVDSNRDGVLNANEECKIIFEIRNNSSETIYDVQPTVFEETGNKHIFISPNIHVESIAPGKGIRYTAMVKADSRLKDGTALFRIAVAQGNKQITSKVEQFSVTTRRI